MHKSEVTPKAVDQHLGEQLRLLRERQGLSMSAVGRAIGTTYQQVRKYETGENRISASTLFRLGQFFEVEVSDFFRGLPSHTEPSSNKASGGAPSTVALDRALDRIEDLEVRQLLGGLLQALGSGR